MSLDDVLFFSNSKTFDSILHIDLFVFRNSPDRRVLLVFRHVRDGSFYLDSINRGLRYAGKKCLNIILVISLLFISVDYLYLVVLC